MLLLGIIKKYEEKEESNLYYTWREWQKDTFSPATEIIDMILFKISGKTYAERKANLQELAKEWQYCDCELSYFELIKIQWFFEKNAKKYGLLKEFKENGII